MLNPTTIQLETAAKILNRHEFRVMRECHDVTTLANEFCVFGVSTLSAAIAWCNEWLAEMFC